MSNIQVPDNSPDPTTLRRMAFVAKVTKHMSSQGMRGIGGFVNEDGTIFAQSTDGTEVPEEIKALLMQQLDDN